MQPRHKHWDRDNFEHLPVNMSSYSSTSAPSTVGLVIPTFDCSIIDLIQKRALENDIRRHYTGNDTFKFMAGVEMLKEVHEVCRLQVDRTSTFEWGTDC